MNRPAIATFERRPSPIPGDPGEEWIMELEDGATLYMMILVGTGGAAGSVIQCLYSRAGQVSAFVLTPDAARAMADALDVLADVAQGIK